MTNSVVNYLTEMEKKAVLSLVDKRAMDRVTKCKADRGDSSENEEEDWPS